jgi:hypothetical protein
LTEDLLHKSAIRQVLNNHGVNKRSAADLQAFGQLPSGEKAKPGNIDYETKRE